MKKIKELKLIHKFGFKRVHNKLVDNISYPFLNKYLIKRRDKSKYQIDGIIITNTILHQRNKSGNPKYAFAFKDVLEDQKAITTVLYIDWNISKDGYIKPTLVLNTVKIGGVDISRVTAFNARYIIDNKLGKNAKIEIIRSGDVIPYIKKILIPAKEIQYPSCEWIWNKTKVDMICKNKINKELQIKNIYYFFSTLNTKGLGYKNVEKIFNSGLDTVIKILKASVEDFLKVDGYKNKSANNLYNSIIKSTTRIPLAILMTASNKLGHGMGKQRIQSILKVYPKLLIDYKKWSKKEFKNNIKKIDGWDEITASLFVNNFNNFINFYNIIKNNITIEISKNKINKINSNITNKKFLFSGFRNKILQNIIEEKGGKISSSVSKKLDYLIIKDKSFIKQPTSKIEKALELKIKIITIHELNILLK